MSELVQRGYYMILFTVKASLKVQTDIGVLFLPGVGLFQTGGFLMRGEMFSCSTTSTRKFRM